jgi:hypothetical protein
MTGPAALGFTLSRSSRVTLGVYDELGRIVALLADGRFDAGRHAVRFNPAGLASGIYHCRLDADGATTVSSVVVYVR